MRYRLLGNTDIEVSTVCLGGWALVGGSNWGAQDESVSVSTINAAIECGITFIDTASLYGRGASEELLGRALGGRREGLVIATKVSSSEATPDRMMRSCEESLRRLRTDYVDVFQVHWPNPSVSAAEMAGALQKIMQSGKARAVGVSNYGVRDLGALLGQCRVATDQLAYSLLWRAIEHEIQPLCRAQEVGILCYSPLSQGLLTGKFRSADDVPEARARQRYFSSARPGVRHGEPGCEVALFEAVDAVRDICARLDRPMAEVALAWLLHQPAVSSVIAGARTPAQIRQNAAAADLDLPDAVVRELAKATEEVKTALGPNADLWEAAANSRIH